jgi:uncharacterized protein YuzE
MDTMNVKIDDLTFDRGHYDAEGDVLYLGRGDTNYASDAALTPEGHGVRYDDSGEVIGVTIINARRIVESDGYLINDHAAALSAGRRRRDRGGARVASAAGVRRPSVRRVIGRCS